MRIARVASIVKNAIGEGMSSVPIRRLSQVAIVLLSALVLLRMPLAAFAEEPTSTPVSIEMPVALTVVAAEALDTPSHAPTIGYAEFRSIDDAPTNVLLIEYSILRL